MTPGRCRTTRRTAASGCCRGSVRCSSRASTRTGSGDWLAEMVELVDAGELSAKTVNNARTCLSMTLGEAVRRGT